MMVIIAVALITWSSHERWALSNNKAAMMPIYGEDDEVDWLKSGGADIFQDFQFLWGKFYSPF